MIMFPHKHCCSILPEFHYCHPYSICTLYSSYYSLIFSIASSIDVTPLYGFRISLYMSAARTPPAIGPTQYTWTQQEEGGGGERFLKNQTAIGCMIIHGYCIDLSTIQNLPMVLSRVHFQITCSCFQQYIFSN